MANGAADQQQQQLADTTNATKGAALGLAAATGFIGAAILVFKDDLIDLGPVLGSGVLVLVAVALVSSAYIVVADMRIRTQVKVAELSEQTAAARTTGGSLSQPAAVAAPMAVRISGDTDRWGVLALRHDAQGHTWYLIGRRGQRPLWIGNDQIEETFYQADPSEYPPRLG